jgi:hypothetical protein
MRHTIILSLILAIYTIACGPLEEPDPEPGPGPVGEGDCRSGCPEGDVACGWGCDHTPPATPPTRPQWQPEPLPWVTQ